MIFGSVQMIVLGIICVFSKRDSILLSGCQSFAFPKQNLVGNSLSDKLRRGTLWNFDKGTAATTMLSLYEESKDENDDGTASDSDSDSTPRLPALGPAGTSSNSHGDDTSSVDGLPYTAAAATAIIGDETIEKTNQVPTFVNPKFALQYTCNVCETKNRVIVSRQAYREGMVIVMCKGCGNKHWIADNLDPALSHSNIEEYFDSQGQGDTVNRVTKEVYEIERVWGLKEGEITDESGDTVLE